MNLVINKYSMLEGAMVTQSEDTLLITQTVNFTLVNDHGDPVTESDLPSKYQNTSYLNNRNDDSYWLAIAIDLFHTKVADIYDMYPVELGGFMWWKGDPRTLGNPLGANQTTVPDVLKVTNITIARANSPSNFTAQITYGYDQQTRIEIRDSLIDIQTARDASGCPLFVWWKPASDTPVTDADKLAKVRVNEEIVKIPTHTIILSKIVDNRDGVFFQDKTASVQKWTASIDGDNVTITPSVDTVNMNYPQDYSRWYTGRVNDIALFGSDTGQYLLTSCSWQRLGTQRYRVTSAFQWNKYGWDTVLFLRQDNGLIAPVQDLPAYVSYLNDMVGYHTASYAKWQDAFTNLPCGCSRPIIYPQASLQTMIHDIGYDTSELDGA